MRIAFDPISFLASEPHRTRSSALRINPEHATLVLVARGALLPGYELASYLGFDEHSIVPILYSRHKLEQTTPHITALADERLKKAHRIVVFDEDVQSGSTLKYAAARLRSYGVPIESISNTGIRRA
jgi:hypoxanthine phosphoribosyltransferase